MGFTRNAGLCALSAALLAGPAGAQDYVGISANLFGTSIPGGGAGGDASADFNGEIDFTQDRLCYYFEGTGLADAQSAHIHEAAEGKAGPEVATLELPAEDADEVCMTLERTLLEWMARDPGSYYVDVHTQAHPGGAVRGQMG
ncbi:hypothetical protein FHS61_001720 [Altererythrobacter atlanticus]|uniref:CHRD domain protein n=1 Tax=Croceibacterium atlanticum TaxID=1267766 RepID=A0A0F7KNQ3_9SPHN|nr:CHRD domain-containing protein [Croceibacterium atlanticum]AKH41194.1 CHRD domain protein [Croceibacterium atlanticum]MBB5732711.1 hypothetical protein [Croceibacterium atlanticum]